MDSKKSMHTPDLYPSIINNKEGSEHLADEFFNRGKHKDIILQSQKENNHGCRNKILKFGGIFKIDGKQASENKSGKNANAAQRCDGDLMNFACIRHVKKLLHVRNIDNYRNRQKSNGEGDR